MTLPRVSVIIPLYNKGAYISRALRSITAQTFQDFEVMVVDDGSTDNGPATTLAYSEPRLRLIHQSNKGPGAARNRGVAEAHGEFVAFLDADDEWTAEYLDHAIGTLDIEPQAATFTCAYREFLGPISPDGLWRRWPVRNGLYRVAPDTHPLLFVHVVAFMTMSGTVCRVNSFRKWGGFAERHSLYGEDAHLWIKMLLNENVYFSVWPGVTLHSEASTLRKGLQSARPLEPFLADPGPIWAACPKHLVNLLAQVLAIRAFKTACQWAYWGHWREALELWQRFQTSGWYGRVYLPCATLYTDGLAALWRVIGRDSAVYAPSSETRPLENHTEFVTSG